MRADLRIEAGSAAGCAWSIRMQEWWGLVRMGKHESDDEQDPVASMAERHAEPSPEADDAAEEQCRCGWLRARSPQPFHTRGHGCLSVHAHRIPGGESGHHDHCPNYGEHCGLHY